MSYYKELASILRKAQGVIDKETDQPIDIGQEVINLRYMIDDLMNQTHRLRNEIRVVRKLLKKSGIELPPSDS